MAVRKGLSSKLGKLALVAGGTMLALQVGRWVVRERRRFDWRGKRVIVTGGSRGLGLVLARQLARAGAKVAIGARGTETLERAANELRQITGDVIAHTCDVRQEEQAQELVARVQEEWGGVDVLFNVAGIIDVGPLDAMTMSDFENAMRTNCWGPLHMVLAVLPAMRRQGWGRIVNVASVGGKMSLPHLLPYTASKFAIVGLSNGLRAELKRENILVTTACPGLMRTGSPRNANFKGRHRQEYTWFSISDSLPGLSMPAEMAASQLMEVCQQGRGECWITNGLNMGLPLRQYFPQLTDEMLAIINNMLPSMGGIGQSAAKGFESHSSWSPSLLTALGEKAAVENNEVPEVPPRTNEPDSPAAISSHEEGENR